ncbi:hypothetical protein [Brevibacillus sp. HD1.4A]|nr:hypothetical protein [Brevibacillus sp. HD1.4A]NRQ51977.1 hypothetical protein [Brevibacillus sp. HD1.4A]
MIKFVKTVDGVEQKFESASILGVITTNAQTPQPSNTQSEADNRGAKA